MSNGSSDIYDRLIARSLPKGSLPTNSMVVTARIVRETVSVKEATAMCELLEEYDARFGEGAYTDLAVRLSQAAQAALMEMPLEAHVEDYVEMTGRRPDGAPAGSTH